MVAIARLGLMTKDLAASAVIELCVTGSCLRFIHCQESRISWTPLLNDLQTNLCRNGSIPPGTNSVAERAGMPNCNARKEKLRRVGAVVLFGFTLCFMMVMSGSGPGTVHADGPAIVRTDGTPPPQPDPTPTPQPPSGSVVTSIQKIIHNLKFDSSKISEALSKVFSVAAEYSESERQAELQTWTGVLSQLVQAPVANAYSTIARSSLKVAGSLAIALFILRLAMYQWNKMLGSEDSPLQVLGDWLTSGGSGGCIRSIPRSDRASGLVDDGSCFGRNCRFGWHIY